MDAQEKKDHEFEVFVAEQVRRYGDLNRRSANIYPILVVACIVMAVAGLFMGKSVLGCLTMAASSIMFIAAYLYYKEQAEEVYKAAEEIQKAIDDPDFDIPDDYPDDILALRSLVCPTLKNVRQQLIAYGVLAVVMWAATAILIGVSTLDSFSLMIFFSAIIMAVMAAWITSLALKAFNDLSVARAYEEYLNEAARS